MSRAGTVAVRNVGLVRGTKAADLRKGDLVLFNDAVVYEVHQDPELVSQSVVELILRKVSGDPELSRVGSRMTLRKRTYALMAAKRPNEPNWTITKT
jgi:hypothetical protein